MQLDQRVQIQRKAVTRASNGEEVVTWVLVATVWAEVRALRGEEFFAGAQMQNSVDHQVRLRWRADITREMRILWGDQPLDIVSIVPLGRHDALEILALAGVRNG